jgi:hypothetical protein
MLVAFTITMLSIFSLFRMLQFLWQSSIVSPNSSIKYLICANSPVVIISHFVNTTLEYWAGTVKWVQWLATGWRIQVSNSGSGNKSSLAQHCTDRGWGSTATCSMGTGFIPRGEAAGQSTPTSDEVMKLYV